MRPDAWGDFERPGASRVVIFPDGRRVYSNHRPALALISRAWKRLRRLLGLAALLAAATLPARGQGTGIIRSAQSGEAPEVRFSSPASVNVYVAPGSTLTVHAVQDGSYTTTPGTGTWPTREQGTVTVTAGTGTFLVALTSVQVYNLPGATMPVQAIQQGPWTVTPGTGSFSVLQSSFQAYNVPGSTLMVTGAFAGGAGIFTTQVSSPSFNVSTFPVKSFAMLVKGTGGAATSWDVRLECALDDTNFSAVIQHTNTDGDGINKFSGSGLFPCPYFRTRVSGLVLGLSATNIVVTILGVQ